ncbi:bifunctional 4-hydroxy-2-oxoglutarate aldolase/2-dehydro-3-deoxy-phosphogluconate aldolase [Legionella sp. km772]|uniref:bifunctional 4-hydroxy-2-oxoglutarate aldolase/2-dehydro-3-deoxy-phosphogluconate aldolase n=1 Tax=Legionella sp. km772 TaxID=2498111 RepID=UPI000F8C9E8D|nr:bifunctional 4-hydroxy-2-oxoglutarate aldolase/2-dehydro-3-deoxy-phosphogluconate aldolase [Legionella sp. km772]RUR11648.1 bifunctional 4-hydroxy-2-oxoglutarate aldolase/2-dehydro-3-deoxy-phosphogluconate aldolase [Legionella sp. km772]
MSFPNWQLHPETVFNASSVIPVIVLNNINHALPLAEALFAGGIKILEVTLRSEVALKAVNLLTEAFPEALIGVGTVRNTKQLTEAIKVGAKFAISPGQTTTLLTEASKCPIPLIPGIATVSELMTGLDLGYSHFKFFPAAAAGGIEMLRSIYNPFPEARFCPTGGINAGNYLNYLNLPNVHCVGGSWIVPEKAIQEGNWSLITDLCLAIQQ